MSKQLLKIIGEICREEAIELECFADDYVLCLSKNGEKAYIYGNKFPNNLSSSELLCDDKAALSQVLEKNGIPCVKHEFFSSNTVWWSVRGKETAQNRLAQMLAQYKDGVVAKDNRGSGGRSVYRITSEAQGTQVFNEIFAVSDSLALCPYINILHEYRVLMLGGEYVYAFEKIRSEKSGEWRHNLGQGAIPLLIEDSSLISKLSLLGKMSVQVLNLDFASVDIIDDGSTLQILEINSGVMVDAFSAYSDEYYALAKNGVRKAVNGFFDGRASHRR